MSCQEIAPLLLARAVSVIEPDEEKELDAHLASCKECPALEVERALHAAFTHAHRRAPEGRPLPVAVPARRVKTPTWPYTLAAGIALIAMALPFGFRSHSHREKPPVDIVFNTPCAVNEVRCYEDPLPMNDPPAIVPDTPLDGTAVDSISAEDPNVAYVEWAVPDSKISAHFLVRGISPGETTFSLKLKSGIERRYHVKIEGISRHELLRMKRREKLDALSVNDLKGEVLSLIYRGEDLEKAARNPDREQNRYPRRACHDYELAEETFEQLLRVTDRTGIAEPDIEVGRALVKQHLERAKESWRERLVQANREYGDLVRRKDWALAVRKLGDLIDLLGDECELDSRRWTLLLDTVYAPNGYKIEHGSPGCIAERVWTAPLPPPPPVPSAPSSETRIRLNTPVPVGDVRCFMDALDEKDPPAVVPQTALDLTPHLLLVADPRVATVEWAVPDEKGTAHFLVQGHAAGDTTFRFPLRSGAVRVYSVHVEGASRHEKQRLERAEKLSRMAESSRRSRGKPGQFELELAVRKHLSDLGQDVTSDGERYRRALFEARFAGEALEVLAATPKEEVGWEDLAPYRRDLDSQLVKARGLFEAQVAQATKAYREQLAAGFADGGAWERCADALEKLVSVLDDECDVTVQRAQLLLQKVYNQRHGVRLYRRAPGCVETGSR